MVYGSERLLCAFSARRDLRLNIAETAAAGRIRVEPERDHGRRFLRLRYLRDEDDPERPAIVFDLPPAAVAGRPDLLLIDLCGGDGCGWGFLDAADGAGRLLSYDLGLVDFPGWRTVSRPVLSGRPAGAGDGDPDVLLPVTIERVGFIIPAGAEELDVGLAALRVS